MASVLISEYMGRGPVSNRPASPNVPSGVAAMWFATDSGILSVWDGSSWNDIVPAGSLSVVQSAVVAQTNLSTGITLPATPQAGNLLLSLVMRNATIAPAASAGWSSATTASGTFTSYNAAFKVAGIGEPATQTPTSTSAANGAIVMWEIAGARRIIVGSSGSSSSPNSYSPGIIRAVGGLILGAAWSTNGFDDAPSITGDATATDPFSLSSVIGGTTFNGTLSDILGVTKSVTATYPTSRANRVAFWEVC